MAGRKRRFKLGGESKEFDLRGIGIGERGKRLMQLSADYARKYGARVRIVPIAKDNNLGGVPRYGAFVHLPPDYREHNTRPVLNSEKNGRFRFPSGKGGSEMLGPYLSDVVGNAVAKAERRAMHNQYPIHNPLPNLEIKNTVKNGWNRKIEPEFLMLNDTIEPPTKKRWNYGWSDDNYDYDSLDKEIGIRLYNSKKNVPGISRIRRNIMGTTSFDLKGGKMRKSQDFIIYPKNSNDGYPPYIFQIQSKTRIGLVDMRTGKIIATPPVSSGAYGVHLSFYINEKAMQSLGTLEEEDYKALFDAIGANSQDWESEPSMIKTDNTGAGQEFFNSVKGREYERSIDPPNPRLPKEGSLDGILEITPDPTVMNAGMPRDPDLLDRLKKMQKDKDELRGKNPKITVKRLKGDYEVYYGGEKVGEIFRAGWGGELEWTLKDFNGQNDGRNNGVTSTGHSTKKSAVETMRFLYGNNRR